MQVWDEMRDAYEFDKQEEIKRFGFSEPPISYKLKRWIPLYIEIGICIFLVLLFPSGSDARMGALLALAVSLIVLLLFVLAPALIEWKDRTGLRKLHKMMREVQPKNNSREE